jgi:AraC-like DNA-binding protein
VIALRLHHFTLEEIADKEEYASTTGLGRTLRKQIPYPVLNWRQLRCRQALLLYEQGKTYPEIAEELKFDSPKQAAAAINHRRGYVKRMVRDHAKV